MTQAIPSVIQFGVLGALTAGSAQYAPPGNGASQANEVTLRVTRAGILRRLYVHQRVGAQNDKGKTNVYTVRKNSVNTALTCTLTGTTKYGADTSNEVSVAAGDQISLKIDGATSAAGNDAVATIELYHTEEVWPSKMFSAQH